MGLLHTEAEDRPLGLQLLSNEIDFIKRALEKLHKFNYKYDSLDLNAACPKKKITSRGEGAALLKTPKKLHKILKALVQESSSPVSVKIRLGWDNSAGATALANLAQDAGIDALFVHGRTRAQGYSGEIDYDSIRKIKKSLHIPVIASGNILNGRLAKRMIDETGCDGLVIARGALGNPWIFQEISQYLKKNIFQPQPAAQEIANVMKEHLFLLIKDMEEKRGVIQFRKFYAWYSKGFSAVKALRAKTVKVKTQEQMLELIKAFFSQAREDGRKTKTGL